MGLSRTMRDQRDANEARMVLEENVRLRMHLYRMEMILGRLLDEFYEHEGASMTEFEITARVREVFAEGERIGIDVARRDANRTTETTVATTLTNWRERRRRLRRSNPCV